MQNKCFKASYPYFTFLLPVIFMILLLMKQTTMVIAVREACLLWATVLLPVLFPYMLAANLFLSQLSGKDKRLYLLLLPFAPICGFPFGAILIGRISEQHLISKKHADILLPAMNLPSPAYLYSIVITRQLQVTVHAGRYLFLFYFSVVIYYLLAFCLNHSSNSLSLEKPNHEARTSTSCESSTFMDVLQKSVTSIINIGAIIVFFRLITECFFSLHLPYYITLIIGGLLEITNGTEQIAGSALSPCLKKCLILFFTAFGGISTALQSKLFLSKDEFLLSSYLIKKFIIAIICCSLYYLLIISRFI